MQAEKKHILFSQEMILSNERANPPKGGDAKLKGLKWQPAAERNFLRFGTTSTNSDKYSAKEIGKLMKKTIGTMLMKLVETYSKAM